MKYVGVLRVLTFCAISLGTVFSVGCDKNNCLESRNKLSMMEKELKAKEETIILREAKIRNLEAALECTNMQIEDIITQLMADYKRSSTTVPVQRP